MTIKDFIQKSEAASVVNLFSAEQIFDYVLKTIEPKRFGSLVGNYVYSKLCPEVIEPSELRILVKKSRMEEAMNMLANTVLPHLTDTGIISSYTIADGKQTFIMRRIEKKALVIYVEEDSNFFSQIGSMYVNDIAYPVKDTEELLYRAAIDTLTIHDIGYRVEAIKIFVAMLEKYKDHEDAVARKISANINYEKFMYPLIKDQAMLICQGLGEHFSINEPPEIIKKYCAFMDSAMFGYPRSVYLPIAFESWNVQLCNVMDYVIWHAKFDKVVITGSLAATINSVNPTANAVQLLRNSAHGIVFCNYITERFVVDLPKCKEITHNVYVMPIEDVIAEEISLESEVNSLWLASAIINYLYDAKSLDSLYSVGATYGLSTSDIDTEISSVLSHMSIEQLEELGLFDKHN